MEHYMTSLRDPMFWKINKNIVDLVDNALKMLPTYSRDELYFPGVEVVNIDVKKMMTAYDYFEFDVTDALKIDDRNSTFNIKIGQPRLNHKSFTIRVNISSLVSKKGLVKIYLGPKLMPGELATKKNLFTLLDMFEINLKIGSNLVSRTSDDMKQFSTDFMSLKTIRKNVEDAEFGLDALPLKMIESQTGYPSRLILPKGTPQGLPLQIFIFVAPFAKASLGDSYSTNSMEFNSAILSPGYPLDLMIEDRQLFSLPNAMTKYVTITQKGDNKVENYGGPGITKQWYGTNSYDPSSRPNYSGNRESYDYNSNKGLASQDIVIEEKNQDDVSHLLRSAKSDYSSKFKGKEPFDYKSKKSEFTKTDYSTKKEDYPNYPIEKEDVFNFNEKSQDDTFIYTPHLVPKFNYETTDYKTNEAKIAKKENAFSNVANQKDTILNTPRLLKSAKFDYSTISKRPEPFDYKAKKAEFDKKDYSAKRGDYIKYRTVTLKDDEITTTSAITTPKSEDEFARVILTKDTNNFDLVSKIKENNIDTVDSADIKYDDFSRNNLIEDDAMLMKRKRTPTVYDFLFHALDYEDIPEMKVYE